MSVTILDNFSKLKEVFKQHTKLDADANMALYINFVNAYFSDRNYQLNIHIAQQLELIVSNTSHP